jgi:hypothetical protein
MTIRAKNLLGFTKDVICQESTLPGYLTMIGTGKVIASSNGPVHFRSCLAASTSRPCWAGPTAPARPTTTIMPTQGWASAVGALTGFSLSGEEKQIDFTGAGTVLVQSSELDVTGSSTLASLLAQLPLLGKEDLGKLSLSVQQQMKQER